MHDVCFNKFLFINHQSIHFIRIFVYSIINLNFNSIVICNNIFLLYIYIYKNVYCGNSKMYIDIELFHYGVQNEHQQAITFCHTIMVWKDFFFFLEKRT